MEILATICWWLVGLPIIWLVATPFILLLALGGERPYWEKVMEYYQNLTDFWKKGSL